MPQNQDFCKNPRGLTSRPSPKVFHSPDILINEENQKVPSLLHTWTCYYRQFIKSCMPCRLFFLPLFLFYFIFFLTQSKGPSGPFLRSATANNAMVHEASQKANQDKTSVRAEYLTTSHSKYLRYIKVNW